MALKPLDIFKFLPKTNCKECGFPTCLAFAMQIAMGKEELAKCPYVSESARAELSRSAAPPIRTVVIGKDSGKVTLGGETVLHRHEKTFYNPTAIGVKIAEGMPEEEITRRIAAVSQVKCERVGLKLQPNLIAVQDEGKGRFKELARRASDTGLALVLISDDADRLRQTAQEFQAARPLLMPASSQGRDNVVQCAKDLSLPCAVIGSDAEDLAGRAQEAERAGVKDIVLAIVNASPSVVFRTLVTVRRAAILGRISQLGHPVLALPYLLTDDRLLESVYAAVMVAKYASALVLSDLSGETFFPLALARLNIFTDPQRPMATPEGVYEIGSPTKDAPVFLTSNFSLTYYIVSGEIENSRTPAYLLVQDTEGLSVLTSWAADKLNAETIAALVKKTKIEEKISHRTLILPGVLSQVVGELEEELPGWKILLGPREASHLPAFVRNLPAR